MELKTKTTLDMLTQDSVSVLTQQFLDINGTQMQVGGNTRTAFMNSEQGRQALKQAVSNDYYNAVIAVWGSEPTVNESVID